MQVSSQKNSYPFNNPITPSLPTPTPTPPADMATKSPAKQTSSALNGSASLVSKSTSQAQTGAPPTTNNIASSRASDSASAVSPSTSSPSRNASIPASSPANDTNIGSVSNKRSVNDEDTPASATKKMRKSLTSLPPPNTNSHYIQDHTKRSEKFDSYFDQIVKQVTRMEMETGALIYFVAAPIDDTTEEPLSKKASYCSHISKLLTDEQGTDYFVNYNGEPWKLEPNYSKQCISYCTNWITEAVGLHQLRERVKNNHAGSHTFFKEKLTEEVIRRSKAMEQQLAKSNDERREKEDLIKKLEEEIKSLKQSARQQNKANGGSSQQRNSVSHAGRHRANSSVNSTGTTKKRRDTQEKEVNKRAKEESHDEDEDEEDHDEQENEMNDENDNEEEENDEDKDNRDSSEETSSPVLLGKKDSFSSTHTTSASKSASSVVVPPPAQTPAKNSKKQDANARNHAKRGRRPTNHS